jgi:hypothetical protein
VEGIAVDKDEVTFWSKGVQYVYALETKKVYRLVKEDITLHTPDDVKVYVDAIERASLEQVLSSYVESESQKAGK